MTVSNVYVGFHTLPCFDRVPRSTEVIENDKKKRERQQRRGSIGGGKGIKRKE